MYKTHYFRTEYQNLPKHIFHDLVQSNLNDENPFGQANQFLILHNLRWQFSVLEYFFRKIFRRYRSRLVFIVRRWSFSGLICKRLIFDSKNVWSVVRASCLSCWVSSLNRPEKLRQPPGFNLLSKYRLTSSTESLDQSCTESHPESRQNHHPSLVARGIDFHASLDIMFYMDVYWNQEILGHSNFFLNLVDVENTVGLQKDEDPQIRRLLVHQDGERYKAHFVGSFSRYRKQIVHQI